MNTLGVIKDRIRKALEDQTLHLLITALNRLTCAIKNDDSLISLLLNPGQTNLIIFKVVQNQLGPILQRVIVFLFLNTGCLQRHR